MAVKLAHFCSRHLCSPRSGGSAQAGLFLPSTVGPSFAAAWAIFCPRHLGLITVCITAETSKMATAPPTLSFAPLPDVVLQCAGCKTILGDTHEFICCATVEGVNLVVIAGELCPVLLRNGLCVVAASCQPPPLPLQLLPTSPWTE